MLTAQNAFCQPDTTYVQLELNRSGYGAQRRTRRQQTHLMAKKTLYSPHPSLAMVQNIIANMKTKTGRTVDEWVAFIKKHGPTTEKERRQWLKSEHELGTNYAWWLAERADGKGEEDADPGAYLEAAERYVANMFAGSKAALAPIYDELLKLGLSIGKDVKACPCKTMVPLYRRHVIAQIKPSTRTRIDFGLALGATRAPKRLIETGGFEKGDRITHRIVIQSKADIDYEVKRWLKRAYELDA